MCNPGGITHPRPPDLFNAPSLHEVHICGHGPQLLHVLAGLGARQEVHALVFACGSGGLSGRYEGKGPPVAGPKSDRSGSARARAPKARSGHTPESSSAGAKMPISEDRGRSEGARQDLLKASHNAHARAKFRSAGTTSSASCKKPLGPLASWHTQPCGRRGKAPTCRCANHGRPSHAEDAERNTSPCLRGCCLQTVATARQ